MLSPTLPAMFTNEHKNISPVAKLREGKTSNQSSRQSSPTMSDVETVPRKRELFAKTEKKLASSVISKKELHNEKVPEVSKKRLASTALNEPTKRPKNMSYSSSEESDMSNRPIRKPMKTKLGAVLTSASTEQPQPKPRKAPSPSQVTVNAPTPVSSAKPKLTKEQRESNNKLLMLKMSKWAALARKQKHESDKYSQAKPLQAGIIAIDALLAYIVAFDYEDRASQVLRRPRHTKSWATLVPYIGWLIGLLEEGDCRYLIGLCYQIRALIHLRMATSYKEQINAVVGDTDSRDFEKLTELTASLIKCNESSVLDFKRGMRDLGNDVVESMFPTTWANRSHTVQPVSKHEGGYRPLVDPYYLPLHSFSTLQEAAALGYAISKEWADNNDIACDWALARGLER